MEMDDLEDLRTKAYEMREVLITKSTDATGPRINTILPHLDQVISNLDDWRIDLLDEEDEYEEQWQAEHNKP